MSAIEIPLSGGKVALISSEDAPRVLAYKWSHHTGKKGKAYACRNTRIVLADGSVKQHKILLHRFLMDAPPELEVDHENGDGLDCQRHNLRVATRAENMANTGPRNGSRTGYKGVYVRAGGKRYRAEITVDGSKRDLGTFRTPEDAAIAYDQAALAAWPEFAFLNFPEHVDLYHLSRTAERVPKRIFVHTT